LPLATLSKMRASRWCAIDICARFTNNTKAGCCRHGVATDPGTWVAHNHPLHPDTSQMTMTHFQAIGFSLKPAFRSVSASLLTAALLLGVPAAAQAQAAPASRVGFVKIERIIKESAAAKQIQTQLEHEFSAREKDISTQDAAFKKAADKFQIDAPTLPATQRTATQQKLAEQERELQRKRRSFQEDLNARKNEELQKLLASTNQIIKKIAESDKLDFVVQDAVYVSPRADITDRVLKAMEARTSK